MEDYMIKESSKGLCKIEGCGLKYYAKDFCKMHYVRNYIGKSKNLNPQRLTTKGGRICLVPECGKKARFFGYCFVHWQRKNRNVPFNTNLLSISKMGGKNPRWKGGISEYEKHYLMKKIGKEKLESENFICQICHNQATEIHHLDKTKNNHDFTNLLAICHKCHFSVFHKQKHTSKYLIWKEFRKFVPFTITSERLAVLEGKLPIENLEEISRKRKLQFRNQRPREDSNL